MKASSQLHFFSKESTVTFFLSGRSPFASERYFVVVLMRVRLFAAPVFLFAEEVPLLTEAADLRIYDLSVFNVNRAAEVLGVIAACQRIGIF